MIKIFDQSKGLPWNHITWVRPAPPFKLISRNSQIEDQSLLLPLGTLLLVRWGHLWGICLSISGFQHQCLTFLITLWWMNVLASQVTVRSLSGISHLLSLFPWNNHSLRSYDRPGHTRMQRWFRDSPALENPAVQGEASRLSGCDRARRWKYGLQM